MYGFSSTQIGIAGYEYWSQRQVADKAFHTVLLQIPDHFNEDAACLLVAPSSGSRNVLGAVGTSGIWALQQGCAVVYSDKGTGTQVVLSGDQQYQIDGTIVSTGVDTAKAEATVMQSSTALHVIQKHPYSQASPEQYWGDFVLDAALYGLELLQQEKRLKRQQIKVIAASISNGGGAVLRAAENDVNGLLDAVVAAEPQINLVHQYELLHENSNIQITTKPLLELSMNLSLYEPCAALHESLNSSPFKLNTMLIQAALKARCQALTDKQLLKGDNLAEQTANAVTIMDQLHITKDAKQLSQLNSLANMWASINHTYALSLIHI